MQLGLPEMIARSLLEKGESLGINRTVMNAVSELRVSDYYGTNNFRLKWSMVEKYPGSGESTDAHTRRRLFIL